MQRLFVLGVSLPFRTIRQSPDQALKVALRALQNTIKRVSPRSLPASCLPRHLHILVHRGRGTLIRACPGAAPSGALKCVQFCSRQNCLITTIKVPKETLPGRSLRERRAVPCAPHAAGTVLYRMYRMYERRGAHGCAGTNRVTSCILIFMGVRLYSD